MPVTYFQRYRMRYDLWQGVRDPVPAPENYHFRHWSPKLLQHHAEVKFRSFRNEMDANVFPCLGDADGCMRLMKEISNRQGFVPEATWLVQYQNPQTGKLENCGTVQGIRSQTDVGAIQNIGIVSSHRGHGLGSQLMDQCLRGFQEAGVRFVTLEVTSHNTGAMRLYQRLGFEVLKTVYKSAEIDIGG